MLVAFLLSMGADGPQRRLEPEKLVFLLQYIGADYGAAVENGDVLDAFEYAEMKSFSEILSRESRGFPQLAPETIDRVVALEQSILAQRPWAAVRAEAIELALALARQLDVEAYPPAPPDVAAGAALYRSDCAACHGEAGGGHGWAPASDPPATSFRDPRMNLISPHQVYNATRFGIDGTAMPSFEAARSEPELWSVAFYVLTLREGFDRLAPDPGLPIDLALLSRASNEELLRRLRAERPSIELADLDHYRLHPPPPAAPGIEPLGQESAAAEPETVEPDLRVAIELENAFGRVADSAFPSTVGVSVWTGDDEHDRGQVRGWRQPGPEANLYPGQRRVSAGSGFFVSADGYLLTCHHVLIDPATGEIGELIDVEIGNRHERARLVAAEPTVDLAVLKIEPSVAVRPVTIGDGARARVGSWVIAIGDPPGVERTFTVGTLAARPERDCYQEQRTSTLLQTSIRIPLESFGGPLLDIRGRAIGMSTPGGSSRLQPGVEASDAPAYGLPIDLAMTLFEPLRDKESRRSPWIGIAVDELTREVRSRLASAPLTGVWVENVFDPGPAASAGVRVGDVLTRLDDLRLFSVRDFQKALYLAGIGNEIEIELVRDTETLVRRVIVEERPAEATPR